MTDLEREAREAAEVYRVACGLGTVGSGQLTHEAIGYAQGFYDAAAPREQELRRLRLLAEEQLTTLRKLKAEMLSDTRDQEIERLRARVAKVTEQRDAWPKYHGTAVEGLMILHDRKDLQDLAGLRCGDFMANAVPHIVAEIDRLRARVAGLEGMVPKWVEWDSDERRNLTKAGAVGIGDDELIEGKWHRLMVPPIPLPETKA